MHALDQLNACSRGDFVQRLGEIYEHSPWVAEAAFGRRPFGSREELQATMQEIVLQAGLESQLNLLRAHPELAGRAAVEGRLTNHSTTEQGRSGLLDCSADELRRLQDLNRDYGDRFGFPFIIAVKGLDRHAIMAAMEARLGNTQEAELSEAVRQVCRIAGYRLESAVAS